jgi:hypothetical protein
MNKIYNVKNRSSNKVIYRIPEMGVRREFMPGESKQISHDELEKLSYRPGGSNIIANYLQISDMGVAQEIPGVRRGLPRMRRDRRGLRRD